MGTVQMVAVEVGETCAHEIDEHFPKRNWHLADEFHTWTKDHSNKDTIAMAM